MRTLLTFLMIGTLCQATNPAIGLVMANGDFRVNEAAVRGNATLFDGSTIETAKAASHLQLTNGVQMRLGSDSRAKVWQGRAVLEKGVSQLQGSGQYELEAESLRITGASAQSVARVRVTGPKQVTVLAMAGTVRVRNAQGLLVASMETGRELSFEPQAGAEAPTKLTGCLLKKDGKYIVVDQTTNVTMEVQGQGLEQQLGNRVEVTGTAEGSVLKAAEVKLVVKGGCASVAKKVGATGAAGAAGTAGAAAGGGAAAGLSTAATVAIVGGVAVAGTVGGLAAAGTFSGTAAPASSSR